MIFLKPLVRNSILPVIAITFCASAIAQDASSKAPSYRHELNVPYRPELLDPYAKERCKLDYYVPENIKEFPTVVWFHGGGLTGGEKSVPEGLKNKGIAVVAAGYRLSPKATTPEFIEDAAAAVDWTFQNVERLGGSRQKIVVSGHSAGGYLAAMIALDKKWLVAHDIDADLLAGIVPLSGQAITHFTIRGERGIEKTQPIIDDLAPLYHVRKDAPPMLLITGDREMELLGRYEENAYLWRMMKEVGHKQTRLLELDGFDHGSMAEPAFPLLLKFIRENVK